MKNIWILIGIFIGAILNSSCSSESANGLYSCDNISQVSALQNPSGDCTTTQSGLWTRHDIIIHGEETSYFKTCSLETAEIPQSEYDIPFSEFPDQLTQQGLSIDSMISYQKNTRCISGSVNYSGNNFVGQRSIVYYRNIAFTQEPVPSQPADSTLRN
ncbi:MAG: hypothetical protein KDD48_01930 [Bdellovibrionales bacterium]|nr:hypothetical protein [Bdellovibrionales bacterium]